MCTGCPEPKSRQNGITSVDEMFWHLKEGMHLPKKGRQMSLAVSEGQKNRNPGGGKTTRGGKSSSRWQFVFPGQVLLVQIQRLVQVRGVGRLCPGDNRGAAEGSRGDVIRGAGLQDKEDKGRKGEEEGKDK